MASHKWEERSAKAREVLAQSIPAEWRISQEQLPRADRKNVIDFPAETGLLTEAELDITGSYATQIVQNIANGTWTATDVTKAFCKRAALAHQVTNCLTVIMFNEALEQAKALDQYYATNGRTIGPLHGLPVSLKDNFNIMGKPSSIGFTSWAAEPMQHESIVVEILRDLGAVLYVKTNIPTGMALGETVNNCYGRTLNPYNRSLTPGGSSGGESALIAMRGSPLGLGTDIAGSIRMPAACTGLYTVKPSHGRFPLLNTRSYTPGQEAIASIMGPLARSLADLNLFAESVIHMKPWLKDPKCLPIPWRKINLKVKPKIAVLWSDGLFPPTPPVTRALQTVVAQLGRAGWEVIDWPADGHKEAFDLLLKLFTADGGKSMRQVLELDGEPWLKEMEYRRTATELTINETWELQAQRTALQKSYLDRWASCEGLDTVLSPTTPYVSAKHGQYRSIFYTSVFNLLDYPAVSFPTGIHADAKVDRYQKEYNASTPQDVTTHAEYDAEELDAMPISLQLITQRLEDEKVVALAEKVLEDIAVS